MGEGDCSEHIIGDAHGVILVSNVQESVHETDPPLVACPRLLAWSMGCSEHIIGDAHGVIPFRRVFTRRIPALRCSFDITEPRSEP